MRMKARRKHLREEGADEGSRRLAEDAEEDAERRDLLLQQPGIQGREWVW